MIDKATKLGAQIVNRVLVFDLLKDRDRIVGAIGIDTREEAVVIIEAPSAILGTGCLDRLYPATPGWMGSHSRQPDAYR